MPLERILKLGDPRLYEVCNPVSQEEVKDLLPLITELHDLVEECRAIHGFGRAIAAPQIGLMKRIICFNTVSRQTIINPILSELSEEMIELWDDCMSFPNLHVRVMRHRHLKMTFLDENWVTHTWFLSDDLSELMQHEYDHLDGILATMRALDSQSFRIV
jgi:peptide deformylase